MELTPLQIAAHGGAFLLGLALVLRPLRLIVALLFRPGVLMLTLAAGLGLQSALSNAPEATAPALTGGALAFLTGAGAGLPLRALTRTLRALF